MKRRLAISFLILACIGPAPHAKKKEVELPLVQHALHRDFFRGLDVPDVGHLLETGYRHVFPGLSPDVVWRGALRLMLQQGILVHVSSDTRVIVCISPVPPVRGRLTDTKPRTFLQHGLPHVLHLRPASRSGTEIVLGWLPDLYRRADRPEFFAVAMTEEARTALTKEFIELLEIEAAAATRWRAVLGHSPKPDRGDDEEKK